MKKLVLGKLATLLLAASVAPGADGGKPLPPPPLSDAYAKWRDHILPSPSEGSYRKITWRASVLHGLVDAQRQDRPLLIVLMNGHPLGCT